jgi:beta-glucosidase/6-phospho-beta-glucosidase/beta-galactosidase
LHVINFPDVIKNFHKFNLIELTFEFFLAGTHDFLGLNYYTTRIVRAPTPATDPVNTPDNDVTLLVDPKWPSSASEHLKVLE